MKNQEAKSSSNPLDKISSASESFNASQSDERMNSRPSESSTFGHPLSDLRKHTSASTLGLENQECNIAGNKPTSDSKLLTFGRTDKDNSEADPAFEFRRLIVGKADDMNNQEAKSSTNPVDKFSSACGSFNAPQSEERKNSNPSKSTTLGNSGVLDESGIQSSSDSGEHTSGSLLKIKNQECNIAGNKPTSVSKLLTFGRTNKDNSEADPAFEFRRLIVGKADEMNNQEAKSSTNPVDKFSSPYGSFNASQSEERKNSNPSKSSTLGNSGVLDKSGIQSSSDSGKDTSGSLLKIKNQECNIAGNKPTSISKLLTFARTDKDNSEADPAFEFRRLIVGKADEMNNQEAKSSTNPVDKFSSAYGSFNASQSEERKNSNPSKSSTLGNSGVLDESGIQSSSDSGKHTSGSLLKIKNQECNIAGNKPTSVSKLFTFGRTDKDNSEADPVFEFRKLIVGKADEMNNQEAKSSTNPVDKFSSPHGSFNASQSEERKNSNPSKSSTLGNSGVLDESGIQSSSDSRKHTSGSLLKIKNQECNIAGNKPTSVSKLFTYGRTDKDNSEADSVFEFRKLIVGKADEMNNQEAKSSTNPVDKFSSAYGSFNASQSEERKNSNPFKSSTLGNSGVLDESGIQSSSDSGKDTSGSLLKIKNQECNIAGNKPTSVSKLLTFGRTDKDNSEADPVFEFRKLIVGKADEMNNQEAKSSTNPVDKFSSAYGSFNASQSEERKNSNPSKSSTLGNSGVLDKSGIQSSSDSGKHTSGSLLKIKNQECNIAGNKPTSVSKLFTFGRTDKDNSEADPAFEFRRLIVGKADEMNNQQAKSSTNPVDKFSSAYGSFNASQSEERNNSNPSKSSTLGNSGVLDESGIQSSSDSGKHTSGSLLKIKNQECNIAGNKPTSVSKLFTFGRTDKDNSEADPVFEFRKLIVGKADEMNNQEAKSSTNPVDKFSSAYGSFNASQSEERKNSNPFKSSTLGNSGVLDESGIQSSSDSGKDTSGSLLKIKNQECNIAGNKPTSVSKLLTFGRTDKDNSEADPAFEFRRLIVGKADEMNNQEAKSSTNPVDKFSSAYGSFNASQSEERKNSNPSKSSTLGNSGVLDESGIQSSSDSGEHTSGSLLKIKNQECNIAGNKPTSVSKLLTFGRTDKDNSEADPAFEFRRLIVGKADEMNNQEAKSSTNPVDKFSSAYGSFNASQSEERKNSNPSKSSTLGNSGVLDESGIQSSSDSGKYTSGSLLKIKNQECNIAGNKPTSVSKLFTFGRTDKDNSEADPVFEFRKLIVGKADEMNNQEAKSSTNPVDKFSSPYGSFNASQSEERKNSNPSKSSTLGNSGVLDESGIQSSSDSGKHTSGSLLKIKNQECNIAGNKPTSVSKLFTFGRTDKDNSEADPVFEFRRLIVGKADEMNNPEAKSSTNPVDKFSSPYGSFNASQSEERNNSNPSKSSTLGNSGVLDESGIQSSSDSEKHTSGSLLKIKNQECNIAGNKPTSVSKLLTFGRTDKDNSEADPVFEFRRLIVGKADEMNNQEAKSSTNPVDNFSSPYGSFNASQSKERKNSNPSKSSTLSNSGVLDESGIQSSSDSGKHTSGSLLKIKNQECNIAGNKPTSVSKLLTFGRTDKDNSEADPAFEFRRLIVGKADEMNNPEAKSSTNPVDKFSSPYGSFNASQSEERKNSNPSKSSTLGNSGVLDESGIQSSSDSGKHTSGSLLKIKDQECNIAGNKQPSDSKSFSFGRTNKDNSEADSESISRILIVDKVDQMKNPEAKSSSNPVDKFSSASGSFNSKKSCNGNRICAGNILPSTLIFNDESKDQEQNKQELKHLPGIKLFQSASGHDREIKTSNEMWDKSSIDYGKPSTSIGKNMIKKTETAINKLSSGHERLVISSKGCENTMKETARSSTPSREMFPRGSVMFGQSSDSQIWDASKELKNTLHKHNAEMDNKACRDQELSKVPLLKDQFKPTHIEQNKAAVQRSSTILTPGELAKIISYYPNFSVEISVLETLGGISPASVHYIASVHPHIFNLGKEVITLEPQVTLCLNHLLETGCLSPSRCNKIHICPAYISGSCRENPCYLGHFWLTDHNLLILEYFYVAKLSPLQLSKLFESLGNVDKSVDSLQICDQYNKNVCAKSVCTELHICLNFVLGIAKCKKDGCFRNHDILNARCRNILKAKGISTNQAPRDVVLALHKVIPSLKENMHCSSGQTLYPKQPRTCWSHYFEGNVSIPEICYYSVESQCKKEESGCPRLHATHHFHWQIKREDTWYNLMQKQSLVLEIAFCDVAQDGIDLQKFDLQPSDDNSVSGLVAFLKQDVWHADFKTMTLVNSSSTKTLSIRRLCTENIHGKVIKASNFGWYFFDQNNVWVKYGDYDTHLHYISGISSDDIEKQYNKSLTETQLFSTSIYSYILDFKTMQQTNQETKVSREVRRRPMPHLLGEKELPSIWNIMPQGKRLLRVSLSNLSTEYKDVLTLLQDKISKLQIKRIERIQNPFLWCAFQNKLREMTAIYGNTSKVNVCQLFHGTKSDVVGSICLENFDWRLHGSNAGQVYGQGTYFSSDAMFSYGYCQPDSCGEKHLFIAKVIVGLVTVGKSSMTRPPKDQVTGVNFDSTADCIPNFTILVKYDKQEYYPEYVISLK